MSDRTPMFWNKVYLTFSKITLVLFLNLLVTFSLKAQTTIAIQNFDEATPTWSYSSDVPFFDNGNDGYFGVRDPFTPLNYPNLMDSVLYERDLWDENDNGTSGFANVTFDPVNVAGFSIDK